MNPMGRADFAYIHPFRVRYSEIDSQGVVFNAHYLTYFDTAITEYLLSLPYDYLSQVRETGTDFHVVKAMVEYVEPIRVLQDIAVGVRLARLGRSSLTFALEIFPQEADRTLARGEVVWVNADQANGKSAPVPATLRALLVAREGEGIAQT